MLAYSRDEKVVSQAVELNEKLDRVLKRHDALLSAWPTSTSNPHDHGQSDEEEEAEQLFRRYAFLECQTSHGTVRNILVVSF